jgi:hypothetical protein
MQSQGVVTRTLATVCCWPVLVLVAMLISCGGKAGAANSPSETVFDGGSDAGATTSCTDDGTIHANGSSWTCSDGCNSCSCADGEVASTLRACPAGVQEGGTPGDAGWVQGAECVPGSSMQYFAPEGDSGGCKFTCSCDPTTIRLQCDKDCSSPPPVPRPHCMQGEMCQPGDGCSSGVPTGPTQCVTGCACDVTGHFTCIQNCPTECGLPSVLGCSLCGDAGTPSCLHYVLVKGMCTLELCLEDGPIMNQ